MYQRPQPNPQFDEFVRTRGTALLRAAFLLTGDQYQAENLVQSALARALRAWQRLQHDDDADAYARTTMYQLQVGWWRPHARRQRSKRPVEHETAPHDSEYTLPRPELKAALQHFTSSQHADVVDLTDRAYRRAYTLGIQRLALGVAAVLVLLAAGITGAVTVGLV